MPVWCQVSMKAAGSNCKCARMMAYPNPYLVDLDLSEESVDYFIVDFQGDKIPKKVWVQRSKRRASPKSVRDVLQSLGSYLEVFAKTALLAFPTTSCCHFFCLSMR